MNISVEPFLEPFQPGSVFHAMSRSAVIVDTNGNILAINRKFRRRIEERSGRSWTQIGQLSDIFCGVQSTLAVDVRSSVFSTRVTLNLIGQGEGNHDPEKMRFEVSAMPTKPGTGNRFLMIETHSDAFNEKLITQSRQLAEANMTAARHRQNLESLEESYKELERFSYCAAHDLKAPLRGISSCLEMLKEDCGSILPEEGIQSIFMATGEAQRLQDLIEALLTLGRSETVRLNKSEVCVQESVSNVLAVLHQEISEVDAEIESDPSLGTVHADDVLLKLLFQNLIGNAIRYRSPDRRPVVRIRRCALPSAGIEVIDNGRGFKHTEKNQIFQPFKRLSQTSDVKGSGVGLAICKRICERHGWDLTAEGAPDEGATFRISFK